jgi:hypothetical protein
MRTLAAESWTAGCPSALLPEIRTRGEKIYLLWRSTVRVSTDADSESKTVRKLRPRS